MPKLGLLIFRPDPKGFEHFLLQVRLVNPHAAAADLDAVQHDIVRLGANFREFLRFKQRYVVRFWSGERMMHPVPFVFLCTPSKSRELCNSKKVESLVK